MEDNMNNKSRRSFLNFIIKGSVVAWILSVLYPIYRYLIPPRGVGEPNPKSIKDGKVDELKLNSGRIVRFGTQPVILIRTDVGDIRAFSAVCTHLGCIVQYRPDLKHIWCACHNGHYDLNGINISGPPPRPLAPYKVNNKDGTVFISSES
jgi:cytochrome b6-f complex iron-sulfur subunit